MLKDWQVCFIFTPLYLLHNTLYSCHAHIGHRRTRLQAVVGRSLKRVKVQSYYPICLTIFMLSMPNVLIWVCMYASTQYNRIVISKHVCIGLPMKQGKD